MTIDLTRPWTDLPYVVLDTETTGLSPADGAGVVELAAVRFEGGFPVAKLSTPINPGHPIPESATAIHGINDDDVANAPPLTEKTVRESLQRLTKGAIPCAYNAPFDAAFLAPIYECEGEWLDPLVIIREVDRHVGGKGRHNLEAACARYGVELTGAHRALADALACGALLWQLCVRGKVKKTTPANKLLEHIAAKRVEQEQTYREFMERVKAEEGASNG